MSKAGAKIIEGLKDAVAGNFSAVTIEGQRWVPRFGMRPIDTPWEPIETAPRDKDFLARLGNSYITRARYVNGQFFASDSHGPSDLGSNTEPTHWMPIPGGPVQP